MEAALAIKLHDDLLAAQPEGARHDVDICPLCVDKATRTTASRIPPGSAGPDVSDQHKSTEGGTKTPMTDISQEAHEALLKTAVADAVAEATKTTEAALATKTTEAETSAARVKELETELATAKADNDRLNKELDDAQVKLTSATEKVAELEKAAKDAEAAAELAKVASERANQVKNLKLFSDEYVAEKASRWAGLDEAAWTEQVEEWKQLKPTEASGDTASDTASSMTGTTESLTKEQQDAAAAGGGETKPKPRRAVLGL